MPDLIRHPEAVEFTGFRLSPLAVTRHGQAGMTKKTDFRLFTSSSILGNQKRIGDAPA